MATVTLTRAGHPSKADGKKKNSAKRPPAVKERQETLASRDCVEMTTIPHIVCTCECRGRVATQPHLHRHECMLQNIIIRRITNRNTSSPPEGCQRVAGPCLCFLYDSTSRLRGVGGAPPGSSGGPERTEQRHFLEAPPAPAVAQTLGRHAGAA